MQNGNPLIDQKMSVQWMDEYFLKQPFQFSPWHTLLVVDADEFGWFTDFLPPFVNSKSLTFKWLLAHGVLKKRLLQSGKVGKVVENIDIWHFYISIYMLFHYLSAY